MGDSLSIPWSENITTFAEAFKATVALNTSLPPNLFENHTPSTLRVIDRCWCDLSSPKGFFEPVNVTLWEHRSVEEMVNSELKRHTRLELEELRKRKWELEEELKGIQDDSVAPTPEQLQGVSAHTTVDMPGTATPSTPQPTPRRKWSIRNLFISTTPPKAEVDLPEPEPPLSPEPAPPKIETNHYQSQVDLPLIRREYDLRPYGMDMVVDFGWSRQ